MISIKLVETYWNVLHEAWIIELVVILIGIINCKVDLNYCLCICQQNKVMWTNGYVVLNSHPMCAKEKYLYNVGMANISLK